MGTRGSDGGYRKASLCAPSNTGSGGGDGGQQNMGEAGLLCWLWSHRGNRLLWLPWALSGLDVI